MPKALTYGVESTCWLEDEIVTASPTVGDIVISIVFGMLSFSLLEIIYASALSTEVCARVLVRFKVGVEGIIYWSSTNVVTGGAGHASSWLAVNIGCPCSAVGKSEVNMAYKMQDAMLPWITEISS